MTYDGNSTYQWNEFSKLKATATSGTPSCGTSGNCFTYDAFGNIVEVSSGSSWKEIWLTPVGTVTMTGTTPSYAQWQAPGGGTAIVGGNSSYFDYLHKDWVGSARVISSLTTASVVADRAFTPYGEMYDAYGSSGSQYNMFAGTTNSYYTSGVVWDTPNRELSENVGRWLSPDPADSGWNQYAYPTNPNSFRDPLGLSGIDCVTRKCKNPRDVNPGAVGDNGAFGLFDAYITNSGFGWLVDSQGNISSVVPGSTAFGSGGLSPYQLSTFTFTQIDFSRSTPGPDGGMEGATLVYSISPGSCLNYVMANCGAANNSNVYDNRANALLQAFRNVPGIQKTTTALNCVTLGASTPLAIPTSVTGAPSYPGLSGSPYFNRAFGWLKGNFPEIATALENSYVQDLVPPIAVANGVATAAQCYNANGAGGSNHP